MRQRAGRVAAPEQRLAVHRAGRRVVRLPGDQELARAHGVGRPPGAEQRLAELEQPLGIARRDLGRVGQPLGRGRGIAATALDAGQAEHVQPPRRIQGHRRLQLVARRHQLTGGREGLAAQGVAVGRVGPLLEIEVGEGQGLGRLPECQGATPAHHQELRVLHRQRGRLGQQWQRLAAVGGGGGPGQAERGLRALRVGRQRLLIHGPRLARVAAPQVGVAEFGELDRILLAKLLGPGLQVGLDGRGRLAPLAASRIVVPEQRVRLVARRPARAHLLEPPAALRERRGVALALAAEQHELRAQCGQHVGVVGGQRLGPPHQRHARGVLLLDRVDRGPQHVGVDAARVEGQRRSSSDAAAPKSPSAMSRRAAETSSAVSSSSLRLSASARPASKASRTLVAVADARIDLQGLSGQGRHGDRACPPCWCGRSRSGLVPASASPGGCARRP